MDQTCLNNHILNIQCKHGALGTRLATALSAGSRKSVCLDRYNVAVSRLLRLLRCYKAFTAEVTYAYKITFTRDSSGTTTVDVTLKDNILTQYSGTGTAEEIAIFFQNQLDAGGLTVDYKTERVGSTLYVYSYDAAASFADTTTIAVGNTAVSYTATNLQNDLDEILNLWNSLTEDQICSIVTMATKFADNGIQNGVGGSNSGGGCNC